MAKRIFTLVSLILGVLGVFGCVVVVVVSWIFASRLTQATEIAFDGFEHAFHTAQSQVSSAEERVEELKLSVEDLNAGLKNWGENEVTTRLNSRLRVEERLSRLESGLSQTSQWLGAFESSLQVVQRAVEAERTLGIPVKTDALDRLLDQVAVLRIALSDVSVPVATIREQAQNLSDEEAESDRIAQLVSVTTRLIATFGSIDTRLASVKNDIRQADARVQQGRTTILMWIRLGAVGITLLSCWMAAGQGSLIYFGIRNWVGVSAG